MWEKALMAGRLQRSFGIMTVAAATLGLLAPVTAARTVGGSCSFAAGTASVVLSSGTSATLLRSGIAVELNGTPCGTATVRNTDLISVTSVDGFAALTLDLSGGAFSPGATDEGDGASEIEVTVASGSAPGDLVIDGSASGENLRIDEVAHALNLNADENTPDDDVTMGPRVEVISVHTGPGDDTVATRGVSAYLKGGAGDDTFVSTEDGPVTVNGGAGVDTVSYAENPQPIEYLGDVSRADVHTNGGRLLKLLKVEDVIASAYGDFLDIGDGVTMSGGPGNDRIVTFAGHNVAHGGPGESDYLGMIGLEMVVNLAGVVRNAEQRTDFDGFEWVSGTQGGDRFIAGRHDMTIEGAGGPDTYSVAGWTHGVRVDLKSGVVSNGDRLFNIKHVVGSRFGDRIVGSGYANEVLSGRAGEDVIKGLRRDDLLIGGAGDDHLDGGRGDDRCRGGGGADSIVRCEQFGHQSQMG
jgi:Ca2+-binding RTX toxin-like protein